MMKHTRRQSQAVGPWDHQAKKNESLEDDEEVQKASSKTFDVKGIAEFFLGFFEAPHACETLKYLDHLERKTRVKRMQKLYGCWSPPPEIAEMLEKPQTKKTDFSTLPDNKDTRNLRYVLKTLGCSLHENRPYKHFLKAQTHRQMKYWLHKYQGPSYPSKMDYKEPICPLRMKRLYMFFPGRFSVEDDHVYFNSQLLTYDSDKRVFYIGHLLDRANE